MSKEEQNKKIKTVLPLKDMLVWEHLMVGLKFKNRFSLEKEPARFIDLLIDYAKKHKLVSLKQDTPLFRARINESGSKDIFRLDRMGAPPPNLTGHGRLNPKGIPYLYLASDAVTAVSEVRPWVGCEITVAEFGLVRDCKLVNFSKQHFLNIPEGEEFEGPEFTWRELITWMFSAPFDPRDDTAYIPTQYLAERIKHEGLDGIIYDSALNSVGYNVTLFDVSSAMSLRRKLARVTAVEVDTRFDKLWKNED